MSSPGAPVSAPAHSSIRTLLEARSVAVVGASRRQDSFGAQLMSQLVGGGFNGDVWPVNPRYSLVQGLACVPSISDLPRTPDLVVLAVPNPLVEQQLKAAAEQGCRSGVIFASLFEPASEGQAPLVDRVATVARSAGMAVCGGNCMGFLPSRRCPIPSSWWWPDGAPVPEVWHPSTTRAASESCSQTRRPASVSPA